MPRTAPPILMLSLLAAPCFALRAEEPAPEAKDEKSKAAPAAPLKLTLTIDGAFVPTVTLTNISDKAVVVVAKNPMIIRNDAPSDAYSITFEPESKEPSWLEFRLNDVNKPLAFAEIAAGTNHTLQLERLSGMYSIGEREVKVTASYCATDRHAKEVDEATAEKFWLGTVRSEPVKFKPSEHPPGVGAIADPEKWEKAHKSERIPHPCVVQSKATMRLSFFAGFDPRDTRGLLACMVVREGLPDGWCVVPLEGPAVYLFGKTGLAFSYFKPSQEEIDRSNEADGEKISAGYRHLGFTEEMEEQRRDPHDFEWTRKLDGAAIHYRVVENDRWVLLIEVWEEEYEKYKPDIEKVFKSTIDLLTGKTIPDDKPLSQPFAPILEELNEEKNAKGVKEK